jgi:hypothetical protein
MFGFPSDVLGLAVYTRRNRFDSQTEQFHEADADQKPCDLVIFGVNAMIPKSLFARRATAGDRPGFAMLHPPAQFESAPTRFEFPKFPCQSAADRVFPRRIPLPAGLAKS